MTDKQIIIDGVDVSGCSCHYNGWSQLYRDNRDMCDKGYDLECRPKENECHHYTKCLELTLKAKEQECEALRKQNKKLKHSFKELNAYIEKAQEWLKKQKLNDIFVDEMRAVLSEELKCLKKK